MLDKAGITEQRAALCASSGQAFYNTSKFTLRDLKAPREPASNWKPTFADYPPTASRRMFRTSSTNFEFRNIIPRLSKADALGTLIAMFLDTEINLSPNIRAERRRIGETSRDGQPFDGHGLRGTRPQVQRREQTKKAGEQLERPRRPSS